MKKYFLILLLESLSMSISAQQVDFPDQYECCIDSIIINTGYSPITGGALPIGARDSSWVISSATPSIPVSDTFGSKAYVINRLSGTYNWAINPITNPGAWISCISAMSFHTDGLGTIYKYTLSRPFKVCTSDSIKFDMHIASDNYISSIDVDGVYVLGFSQPSAWLDSNYSVFTPFFRTLFLSAGPHILNVVVNNQDLPSNPHMNPCGLNIYGTISSASGGSSIVRETDTCYSVTTGLYQSTLLNDVVSMGIFPNPSYGKVKITYRIPRWASKSVLEFYNVEGRMIKSVVLDRQNSFIEFNDSQFESGVYYCRLLVNGSCYSIQKMVVLK